MANLVLKNVDQVLIQSLEQRAKRLGITLEAAAVHALSAEHRPDNDAPTLGERQAALASAYPDEYVVLLGERVLVHTLDKDEAYAHYENAFDEAGGLEPIVVAPGALRRLGPPVIRGRALSGTTGTTR